MWEPCGNASDEEKDGGKNRRMTRQVLDSRIILFLSSHTIYDTLRSHLAMRRSEMTGWPSPPSPHPMPIICFSHIHLVGIARQSPPVQ